MDDLDNLRRITEHLRMIREIVVEEVERPMAIDCPQQLEHEDFLP